MCLRMSAYFQARCVTISWQGVVVTEWMTMSAPCSMGRIRYGVANVESTARGRPAPCATSATAAG